MTKQDSDKDRDSSNLATQLGLALSIPTLLAAGPLVGYGLGWLIQHLTGWGDWIVWLFVMLGLASGIRETVLVIRRLS